LKKNNGSTVQVCDATMLNRITDAGNTKKKKLKLENLKTEKN